MQPSSAIILGIVQGLTEFLPISSSGHLVLFQSILEERTVPLLFDISLHLGTLFAILLYFLKDIKALIFSGLRLLKRRGKAADSYDEKMVIWILVSNIPTAFIGLFFKDHIEKIFVSLEATGVMLIITGLFLAMNLFFKEEYAHRNDMGISRAFIIGIAQGVALVPGISRSGITIISALALGLKRELSGRFSFLISIPAIIGAMGLEIFQEGVSQIPFIILFLGFMVSLAVGVFSLRILMWILKRGSLHIFSPYCILLGSFILSIK